MGQSLQLKRASAARIVLDLTAIYAESGGRWRTTVRFYDKLGIATALVGGDGPFLNPVRAFLSTEL